ncbi:MAG: restriction endonuclease subunit S, partial [Oscillospiraceae bacterium]|nr:restriction endonuclease subunit S [Oscillospiraceae bacterium]
EESKYEKLNNLKKAMLEKTFPKDGADVPELRFKGFTAAWEQRKLGEIADIIGGGTPSTNISEYWDGDIDWYAPAEMEGQRYAVGSVRKITDLGLQKSSARILPAGRTVLFTSRAGIGKIAILQHSAATNQGFQSLVLRDGYNPYFVYSMGDQIKKKAESVASGSTFLEISGRILGSLEIMVPSLPEQGQIADYFRHLDDLITLHQRKLEKLKNLKKALLEKMFV